MKKFGWMILLAGLVAGSVLTTGVLAQTIGGQRHGRGGLRERILQRLHARGARLHELGRALALTPAQAEQALAIAQAAEPLAREVRKEIARARIENPRTGERGAQRELVQHAFRTLEPQLRGLVASLTPEQRARLEALAHPRGRTLDDGKLVKRLAFLLSRPMAAPLLEARLGR